MDRRSVDKLLTGIGVVATVILLVIGGLSWWAYSFTTNNVSTELASQKIFFPVKGSPALDPKEFPDLQQYAGQQVDDGPTAKAYANGFIGRHLEKIAGGKTYSEVSAESQKHPQDAKLKAQAQTLFQGETLRGLLLGDGYAFWTIGLIAKYAALASWIAGGVMLILVLLGLRRLRRN
jgi:hypothetical protein